MCRIQKWNLIQFVLFVTSLFHDKQRVENSQICLTPPHTLYACLKLGTCNPTDVVVFMFKCTCFALFTYLTIIIIFGYNHIPFGAFHSLPNGVHLCLYLWMPVSLTIIQHLLCLFYVFCFNNIVSNLAVPFNVYVWLLFCIFDSVNITKGEGPV